MLMKNKSELCDMAEVMKLPCICSEFFSSILSILYVEVVSLECTFSLIGSHFASDELYISINTICTIGTQM